MGDRICVMRDGNIMQVADPLTLYRKPLCGRLHWVAADEGFAGVSSGIGEPFVFVAAYFSRENIWLSVESTRVESLVKIL